MDVLLTGARRGRDLLPALLPTCVLALAYAVQRFDAPLVLIGLVACVVVAALFLRPEMATVVFVFLLYTNIPAVAHQLHGVPRVLAAAFPLLLAAPLLHRTIVRREGLRAGPIFGLMLCFLAVMLLSSFGSIDRSLSFNRIGTYILEGLLIYFLVINVIRSEQTLRRVIWTVLFAASFLGSLSLYQAVTGSYTQQFGGLAERQLKFEHKRDKITNIVQDDKLYKSDRADGPLLGTNRYAQVMIVLLPLAVVTYRTSRSRRTRLLALAAGGLILSGMFLTYSRGAMIVFVLILLVAAWVKWIPPRYALATLLVGTLTLPFTAPVLYARFASVATVRTLVQEGPAAEADGAILGRATEMLAALHVFLDHPLVGVGPAQYTPHYSIQYQQTPEIKFRDIENQRRAHILYFELAAELGFFGLLVFLTMPVMLLRAFWRLHRERPPGSEEAELAMGFFFAILCYLGTAVFLHLAYERYYWFLLALAAATLTIIRRGGEAEPRLDAPARLAEAAWRR